MEVQREENTLFSGQLESFTGHLFLASCAHSGAAIATEAPGEPAGDTYRDKGQAQSRGWGREGAALAPRGIAGHIPPRGTPSPGRSPLRISGTHLHLGEAIHVKLPSLPLPLPPQHLTTWK